jgi:hypothetical protein
MTNQEIIEKLVKLSVIYPLYQNGDVLWIVEFSGGDELIGEDGFTWDEICNLYRKEMI